MAIGNKLLLAVIVSALLLVPASAVNFEADKFIVKTVINSGESSVQNLKVTNIDKVQGDFVVTQVGVNDLLRVSAESFSLAPEESRDVSLSFSSFVAGKGYTAAGIYTGKINIKSGEDLLRVPVILELQHANVITDNKFTIGPENLNTIAPGKELPLDVSLINLKDSDSERVSLRYYIKDLNDRIILEEAESVSFSTANSFTKYLTIPKVESGNYVIGIESDVEGDVGTSSSLIEIKSSSEFLTENIESYVNKHFFVIIIIIAIVSLMVTVISARSIAPPEAAKRKK